jgi:hypothetical protein
MAIFFFYNKLTNIELIKRINNNFEIYDGYIIIQNYDIENNVLEISDKSLNNDKLLYGKIVNFNMTINDVLQKINEIEECKLKNKLQEIWTNKTFGGTYKAYIIY